MNGNVNVNPAAGSLLVLFLVPLIMLVVMKVFGGDRIVDAVAYKKAWGKGIMAIQIEIVGIVSGIAIFAPFAMSGNTTMATVGFMVIGLLTVISIMYSLLSWKDIYKALTGEAFKAEIGGGSEETDR